MLGAVQNADVELVGTNGRLGMGRTDANGRFPPISFSGNYDGPLRIVVSGDGASTWICDFRLGCSVNGSFFNFGDSIAFDFVLEAVLPNAADGQMVSVSQLSNFVSARAALLGTLSSANVMQAEADIAAMLELILGDTLANLGIALPSSFSSIELVDISQLPTSGGATDQLGVLLSLLNSALMGLSTDLDTAGDFVLNISASVAAEPILPVAASLSREPSQEIFLAAFLLQVIDFIDFPDAATAALNDLLLPQSLDSVRDSAVDTWLALPALWPEQPQFYDIYVPIDDATLQNPIEQTFEVITNTGAVLTTADIDVSITSDMSGDWLTAQVVEINGLPHVHLEFDNAAIAALPNGSHVALVETFSLTGEYRRIISFVEIDVALVGTIVDAGADISADERSTVLLSGFTNRPNEVQQVNWVQTAGPTAIITDGSIIIIRLDVEFTTGETLSDFVDIGVLAFPNIADVYVADPVLQQCIDDTATAGGLVEVQELQALSCIGATDVLGLDVFSSLSSLELQGNTLQSLQTLVDMTWLTYVDISGNQELPCTEIDALAQQLVEGATLIVDDICRASLMLDLAGTGFDVAKDELRNQLYVSIPDRNELAVISLADLRIVNRIQLPGRPYGIDLSIDGSRVFVALNGSNAIAVLNIDLGTVSTIALGDSTGHSLTYDVVEGATDRLFVSASPGSSGFAYIAQVRLDQGNLTSRAANEQIIRATPALARSPDMQFVYVGAGFSPNSLYKLSLTDPDAGIVLEDDPGAVSGTSNLVLNATGSRISLASGQILRTASFIQEGQVSSGVTAASNITDTLFVARPDGEVYSFDFTTLITNGYFNTGCSVGTTSRLVPFNNDESFVLLQGGTACAFTYVSRSAPMDLYSALRFPDLALEECVINEAVNAGFTEPEDFTVLDCSLAAKTIGSLETLDRMINLEQLNMSNSSVYDLSPLATMSTLRGVEIQDAAVTDVKPLFALESLANLDVRGNNGIPCVDLNQLATSGVNVLAGQCSQGVRVELGGVGADMVLDEANDRAFVSIPSLQEVVEINLSSASISQRRAMSGQPYGIDLAADNTTLYAALNGIGDIAYLNVNDGTEQLVDLSTELDHDSTWDVAEVSADRIVVSANPNSGGFAYIVEVRRDLGNAATRVADDRIIRAGPIFAISPDSQSVYVGEGFSPNSLFKLDATKAALPIVLEDDHGEVFGTDSLALNADGSRIHLRSGQVLETNTFTQVALFPAGRSAVSVDDTKLLVADGESSAAGVYDVFTTRKIGSRDWGCDIVSLLAIHELGGDRIVALGDDLFCFSEMVNFP
jgi:DNA-binding beta-propeller fold protein YncE